MQSIAAKGEKLKTVGNNISNAGTKLLPVTAGVVGLGTVAVKTAADFDSAMSKVAAASSNANTNVSMMGETFKYCAPIAGALGFSAVSIHRSVIMNNISRQDRIGIMPDCISTKV